MDLIWPQLDLATVHKFEVDTKENTLLYLYLRKKGEPKHFFTTKHFITLSNLTYFFLNEST